MKKKDIAHMQDARIDEDDAQKSKNTPSQRSSDKKKKRM